MNIEHVLLQNSSILKGVFYFDIIWLRTLTFPLHSKPSREHLLIWNTADCSADGNPLKIILLEICSSCENKLTDCGIVAMQVLHWHCSADFSQFNSISLYCTNAHAVQITHCIGAWRTCFNPKRRKWLHNLAPAFIALPCWHQTSALDDDDRNHHCT